MTDEFENTPSQDDAPTPIPTPWRIPLSPSQQRMFQDIQSEITRLTERRNLIASAIVAGVVDPDALQGWATVIGSTEIIATPPSA